MINKAVDSKIVSTPERSSAGRLSFEKLEELLLYFSTSISHFNTEEEIAWDLVKNCIARLNFSDCVIYFIDKEKKVLVQLAAHGPKNPRDFDIVKPIEIPLGEGITGAVALSGLPEIVHNTEDDPRYIVDDERRLSEITIPIVSDGEVIGVIDCEHPEKNFFTGQHFRLLTAIASFYGVRISKLRAEKREEKERNKLIAAEKGLAKMRLQVLNTQLGPHFLFNSINAIQHFLVTDNKRPALNYLSLFSKLIRRFLGSLDKDSISVSEEATMLEWYLQLQQLRYDSKFQYQLQVQPEHQADDAKIPPFLAQSLVENFLEVMIPQNVGTSAISVSFNIDETNVVLILIIEALHGNSFSSRMPEYRRGLTQWNDHIEIYNRIKKYNITYTIEDKWVNDALFVSKRVELHMPNIA